MPSIADNMLAAGVASHIEAIHGEPVFVETGPDAGRTFTAVVEIDTDAELEAALAGPRDRRARRQFRFLNAVPQLSPNFILRTADGRRWSLVDHSQGGYLSTDFQAVEITAKDQ